MNQSLLESISVRGIAAIFFLFPILLLGQPTVTSSSPFFVSKYTLELETDAIKNISGRETIKVLIPSNSIRSLKFACGDLTIDSVYWLGKPLPYIRIGKYLTLEFPDLIPIDTQQSVHIVFHGSPRYGLSFFPADHLAYTGFSTSQWMICLDAPDQRAAFTLHLILPHDLQCVGIGSLLSASKLPDGRIKHIWCQDKPLPSYTYGFAFGKFTSFMDSSGNTKLSYLADGFSCEQLQTIFADTPDMLNFFEQRAGVSYPDPIYTQVLVSGHAAQEMNSFTVIDTGYAKEALTDSEAIGMFVHEFAHQWWGNMVTCRDWRHFWLNEGMATFMVAAYREHRFGHAAYEKEMATIKAGYDKVREKGIDKPLVFPDWDKPTRDDRILVYDKGGYVLHLLKLELGDELFWKGIRAYTREYFGKSVTTPEFQLAMETATQKNLSSFFSKWVYSASHEE